MKKGFILIYGFLIIEVFECGGGRIYSEVRKIFRVWIDKVIKKIRRLLLFFPLARLG